MKQFLKELQELCKKHDASIEMNCEGFDITVRDIVAEVSCVDGAEVRDLYIKENNIMKKEVVHVPTRELAEEVLRVAKENGLYQFNSSINYMLGLHKSSLCLSFDMGGFLSIKTAQELNNIVITAQEFLSRYNKEELSELDQLRKENEELKKQLQAIEDQPKVGDVCLFWDEDMNSYLLSVLKTVHLDNEYPFKNENGLSYNYCIKATDENIQAKIKELQDDTKTT